MSRRALLSAVLAVSFATGCSKVSISMDNLACTSDEDCVGDYTCSPTDGVCVAVGACTETGTPTNCSACGDDCTALNNVVDGSCESDACVIGACVPGWVDENGLVSDGCEAQCAETAGGVEICDGLDNDCDGITDNALPDATGCTGETVSAKGSLATFSNFDSSDSHRVDENLLDVLAGLESQLGRAEHGLKRQPIGRLAW